MAVDVRQLTNRRLLYAEMVLANAHAIFDECFRSMWRYDAKTKKGELFVAESVLLLTCDCLFSCLSLGA